MISFEKYLSRITKLDSFRSLEAHLITDLADQCQWREDLHPCLEQNCLTAIKFKVERVSSAQAIFELACAFSE